MSSRILSKLNSKSRFLVSTPIFYLNDVPHIGALYSLFLADAVKKVLQITGNKAILSTGTDEHGLKVFEASKGKNISEYCDKISSTYKALANISKIDYNCFIRTTEKRHERAVHHFWNQLKKSPYISFENYKGQYFIDDEDFLNVKEKNEIEQSNKIITIDEMNYMFNFERINIRSKVLDVINASEFIHSRYLKRLNSDFGKLEKLSLSRNIQRVKWGIEVPDDSSQTIYVWVDALINYYTALNYPDSSPREEEIFF